MADQYRALPTGAGDLYRLFRNIGTHPVSGDPVYAEVVGFDTTTSMTAVGNVAAGSADSGNPVKIGGVYKATPATLSDGQRSDILTNNLGVVHTQIVGNSMSQKPAIGAPADAQVNANSVGLYQIGFPHVFNGTTWDRTRSDGTTGGIGVGGTVASGVADSGNPVKIGGVYATTRGTLADGNRGNAQLGARGQLIVAMEPVGGGLPNYVSTPSADGISASANNVIFVGNHAYVYNGTTWDRMRTDGTTGGQGVGGTVAAGAADSGNPVKIGGVYNTTEPTLTTGQRGNVQLNSRGHQFVELRGINTTGADGLGNAWSTLATNVPGTGEGNIVHVLTRPAWFNGTTWDRVHGNWNTTTGDSGAKAATFNGATQTNFDSPGAMITVVLGTVTGTSPTLACQLQWSPDGGTTWMNLGPAMANLTASSQTGVFVVYPTNSSQAAGATPANLTTGATQTVALNASLPRTWRVLYTIGGTTPSFTISAVNVSYLR